MKYYILALLMLSAATHFSYFGRPAEVVFDEVHFGNFASAYDTHEYFFDIHPPLGKLMISAAGYLGGFDATSTNYGTIGNEFTDPRYIWYRILPMLAGFALPLVIFFLCLRLGLSKFSSFFAGMSVILENSLLVQSRFIFLDSFLLLFGFSAILLYLKARQSPKLQSARVFLVLSAVMAGLAVSIKWTGLGFVGLIALVEFVELIRDRRVVGAWKKFLSRAFGFFAIGLALYFSIFLIHFSLLPKSGNGDAFMTPSFQKTLIGNGYEDDPKVKPEGTLAKFIELNTVMFNANKTLTATHSYSSKWYTWPFMTRPIYYWNGTNTDAIANIDNPNPKESKIYLIGNLPIYLLSFSAMFFLIGFFLWHIAKDRSVGRKYRVSLFLICGYLLNWLPFILIGRVMFLYHYETALVFAIIALAFMIDQLDPIKQKIRTGIVLLVLFAGFFLYFCPLTYGLPMTNKQQNHRFWFESWK